MSLVSQLQKVDISGSKSIKEESLLQIEIEENLKNSQDNIMPVLQNNEELVKGSDLLEE